jgi:hypothetical protein
MPFSVVLIVTIMVSQKSRIDGYHTTDGCCKLVDEMAIKLSSRLVSRSFCDQISV